VVAGAVVISKRRPTATGAEIPSGNGGAGTKAPRPKAAVKR
jgi:hypothetical protein